jgi:hypothetical protein
MNVLQGRGSRWGDVETPMMGFPFFGEKMFGSKV